MRCVTLRLTKVLLVSLLAAFSALAQESAPAEKQGPSGPPARFLPNELEALSLPIALYPDVLLAQILPAATFPDQIVDAALLIKTKEDAKQIADQSWDPSIKAIANYPGILKMMYEKLDWTKSLGDAFLTQHKELLDAIQRLRTKAKGHGNLESNQQQKVTEETTPSGTTVIRVEPAEPQVIYVPQTTSTVYTQPVEEQESLSPLITFGAGMLVGSAISGGHDDDDDDVYVYGGYPPRGIWHDEDYYEDWQNERRDRIERSQDQANERQGFRQDQRSERQDFRQGAIEDGSGQRGDYYRERKEMAQDRYNTAQDRTGDRRADAQASKGQFSRYQSERQKTASAARTERQNRESSTKSASTAGGMERFGGSSSSRPTQYQGVNRQQQLDAARRDLETRQSASRGYGKSGTSYQSGAFAGVSSGSRASTYSSRGAQSRAGSYGGSRNYGARSAGGSGGGGMRSGGGGSRGGGGGRRR